MDEQQRQEINYLVNQLLKLGNTLSRATKATESTVASELLYKESIKAAEKAQKRLTEASTDEVRARRAANAETHVYAQRIGKTVKNYDKLTESQRESIKQQALAAEASGKSTEQLREETQTREKATKIVQNATLGFIRSTASLAGNLTSSGNGFSQLGTITQTAITGTGGVAAGLAQLVPLFGDGIARMIDTGTAVIKQSVDIIIQSMVQQFDAYRSLTGEGFVNSITKLRQNADATGLRFEDLAEVLRGRGNDLAGAFSSAQSGAQRFASISSELQESGLRDELLRLGLSVKDVNEASVDAIQYFRRTGQLRGRTDAQLARMTADYIKELDELTKLTGLSRREQQDIQERALSETRYRAFYETLERGERQRLMEANRLISATFGKDSTTAAGIRDLLASGGAAVTEAAKAVLVGYGTEGERLRRQLAEGTITAAEFTKGLARAGAENAKNVGNIARIQGDSTIVTKLYNEQIEAANRSTENLTEEQQRVRQAQKEQTSGADVLTTTMTNTNQQMYNAGRNLQQLSSGFEFVGKTMDTFSDSIDAATTKLYEFTGESLPEHLKARKEERAAIQEQIKIQKKLAEIQKPSETSSRRQRAAYNRQLQDLHRATANVERASARRQAAERVYRERVGTSTPSVAPIPGAQPQPQPAATPIGTISHTRSSLEELGLKLGPPGRDIQKDEAAVSPKLLELAKQIQENVPGFKYFSGFNDRFHHNLDYNSKHTSGMALDFVLQERPTREQGQQIANNIKSLGASSVRDEYNNRSRRATGPHFHVEIPEFAKGGIITGPTEGYQATLHGQEAVVPLNNNLQTQQLDLTKVVSEIVKRADVQQLSTTNNLQSNLTGTISRIIKSIDNSTQAASAINDNVLTNLPNMLKQSITIPLTSKLESKITNLTDIIKEANIKQEQPVVNEITTDREDYTREFDKFMQTLAGKFDAMIDRMDTQISNQDKQIQYLRS